MTRFNKKKEEITFDLLKLHDPKDDITIKRCLRVYTILPKYCGFLDERNKNSEEIIGILKNIDKKAKIKFGKNWKKEWIKRIGLEVKVESINEWIRGRVTIPLIALEKLKEMGFEKEIYIFLDKISYVCSATKEIIRVPKFLNSNILYLTGLLLSDGYIQKTKRCNSSNFEYGISIFGGNKLFFENEIIPLLKKLFHLDSVPLFYWHQAWTIKKKNKILFRFFNKLVGMHSGKKSIDIRFPFIIHRINKTEAIPFLAGLIDGDIGKHGKGMGGTFRSERFVDDVIKYLHSLGVNAKKGKTNILANGHIQNELRILPREVEVLKDVMARTFLPKSSARLQTLFCRGTKAV